MNGNTADNTIATGVNADGKVTTAGGSSYNHVLSCDGQEHPAGADNTPVISACRTWRSYGVNVWK